MRILALETSCDDTSVALIEAGNFGFKIISNIVSSQINIHQAWGGVVPNLAKREHQKNLPPIIERVLAENKEKIDYLAVTLGPGLEPCLWVGVNFARDLAKNLNLSIIPVNHVEAHILANFINKEPKADFFPALGLIVSGGHTELVLIKKIGNYELIGETRDDAAGECFDKIAKILGLGYPGGPIIAKLAEQFSGAKFKIVLPRPMIHQKNYDFSFSGLKTAVLYDYKSRSSKEQKSEAYIQEIAFEAQKAIIDVLIKKTFKAAAAFRAKSIILGGGVAANEELRKQFSLKAKEAGYLFSVPEKEFCTDNAVMVGAAGFFNQKKKTKDWDKLEAKANLKISL